MAGYELVRSTALDRRTLESLPDCGIAAMVALPSFFVFSASAGEGSPLLSLTTTQPSAVAQSAADVATIDRAS